MSKIKIGIIGAGAIAKGAFLPGFSPPDSQDSKSGGEDWFGNGCEGVELFAISSRTRSKAEALAIQFGIKKVFNNYDDLIADPEVDVVCILTPNNLHFEITLKALEAKKHVLVKKPIAITWDEAVSMVNSANNNNCILMVNQSQRFFKIHETAKKIVETGVLGPILTIRARWSHLGPEHWSSDGNRFFDRKQAGHGVLFDLGIHKFDLIRYLTGKEASEVNCFMGTLEKNIAVDDNAITSIKFTDGSFGVVEASWTSPVENSIRIHGTKGFLQVGSDSTFPISVHFNEEKSITEIKDKIPNEKIVDGKIFIPKISAVSETGGIFRRFIDSVRNGTPNIASGEDNLGSFAIAFAAAESAKLGRTVTVPKFQK